MAALEALALGLSIVFVGFVLLLLAELFYVFVWKRYGILRKRVRSIGKKCNRGVIGNLSHEAALVGSLGDYSASSVDTEFVENPFPMGPEAIGRDTMFMDGVFPRFLYTIKEETAEDMEFEEPVVNKDKESAASFLPVQTLQSESPKRPSESPFPKQQQMMQRHFPHSIGVFQQPQILRSISKKSISWTPTATQQQNALPGPSDLSLHSSCNLPSSPPHPSSSSSSSSPTSASISPTLASPRHQAFCSPGSSFPELLYVSKPVYDLDSNGVSCNTHPNVFPEENEAPCDIQYSGCSSPHDTETPFDTPISSPSLLTPCGSPPMTPRPSPIKASKDRYGISIKMANHGSGTSYTSSSAESDPSSSSSKCSSPSSESWHESPIFHHPRRSSMSPAMVVPSYPNKTTWKPALLDRRAFEFCIPIQ